MKSGNWRFGRCDLRRAGRFCRCSPPGLKVGRRLLGQGSNELDELVATLDTTKSGTLKAAYDL